MSHEHHNATWHRLSKQVLCQRPICQDPFGYHVKTGRFARATCVHHIESVKVAPTRLFDSDNLLALCQTCHDAIHAKRDALCAMLAAGVDINRVARVVATRGLPERGGGNRTLTRT